MCDRRRTCSRLVRERRALEPGHQYPDEPAVRRVGREGLNEDRAERDRYLLEIRHDHDEGRRDIYGRHDRDDLVGDVGNPVDPPHDHDGGQRGHEQAVRPGDVCQPRYSLLDGVQ